MRRLALLVLLHAAAAGCSEAQPTEPFGRADLTILFVGNSLTYTHDLPGAVATVAEAAGHDVAVAEAAYPSFALEDHWNRGIAGVKLTRSRHCRRG